MVTRSVLVLSTSLAAASAAGARGVLRRRALSDSDRVRSHLEGRRRRFQSVVYAVPVPAPPREDASAERAAGDRCSFCSGGVPDPSVVLPGNPGEEVTCGQVKTFADTLSSDDGLCATATMGEALCCPAGEAEGEGDAVSEAVEEGDGEEVVEEEGEEEECSSIYEIASSNAAFSTLNLAIDAAGLGPALKMPGTFTVFAPLNSAFEKIFTPEIADKYLDPLWKPQLQDLVLYHTLGSEVYSSDLSDGLEAPTVNFAEETVLVNLDPARVNGNSIIQLADVEACNGVVHEVSEVLLPSSVTSDIVDLGVASEDFSTLVAAVEAAGLVETLKGEGPFTLFAPTNDAFAALPEGTVEALLLPENRDMLVSILTYHVVPANALSNSLESGSVATVNGDAVNVSVSDGGITVNDASVIQANVIASNGIVHMIDAVLLPPEEPEMSQTTESPPITFTTTTEEPEVELTTESPTTEAPATEAPVTEAPATEAPVTEAPATEAPVTEAPANEAPVTEAPATEAPVTEAPATEAPVTEALEDVHEVEPVPPPPASTEAPWSGADAMLGKSAKSKGGKAKCGKSKSSKGGPSGDDDDECAGHMSKVSKQYAAGKSGKTKQAEAHFDIDTKAEKITKSKGSKKTLTATPAMSERRTRTTPGRDRGAL